MLGTQVIVTANYESFKTVRGRALSELAERLVQLFGSSEAALAHASVCSNGPGLVLCITHAPPYGGYARPQKLQAFSQIQVLALAYFDYEFRVLMINATRAQAALSDTSALPPELASLIEKLANSVIVFCPDDQAHQSWHTRDKATII